MIVLTELTATPWRDQFLLLIPKIEHQAAYAFRGLALEARDEAVAEVVANACLAFKRMFDRGKARLAYVSSLTRFAIAQFWSGRRVGTPTNSLDVTSPAAVRKHGHQVKSLTKCDDQGSWRIAAIEDKSSGPAEVAQFRIDFQAWLQSLPRRQCSLAIRMSEGFSTAELADLYGLSPSRISQSRRELESSWNDFFSN